MARRHGPVQRRQGRDLPSVVPEFADRFALDVIGYVEPQPGIPPSPQHTRDLMSEMKRLNVKIVLVEPTSI